jgi:hypothetical protein
MEPGATVADWRDGSVTLYDSTQGVERVLITWMASFFIEFISL